MSNGDEVGYHEHYDLASAIQEVEQQAMASGEAIQGLRATISRLESENYDLRSQVSVLRIDVAGLSARVDALELT